MFANTFLFLYFFESFLSQLFLFLLETYRVIVNKNRLFSFNVSDLDVKYLCLECTTNSLFQVLHPLHPLLFCFCLQLVYLGLGALIVHHQVESLFLFHHLNGFDVFQSHFVLRLSTPFIHIPKELFVNHCKVPFVPLVSALLLLK